MVLVKEFRIVMPMSLEEYEIAQMYMVTKMQKQSTNSDERVDVLVDIPFEDDILGKGQYTSKVYYLQSKAPAWLATIAPAKALIMQEESWNAYPKCKTGALYISRDATMFNTIFLEPILTVSLVGPYEWMVPYPVIKCPYFSKFVITIQTIHVADNGKLENVHGLSKQKLATRQMEVLDIASAAGDSGWTQAVGSNNIDLSKFKSERSGRGPLLKGWQDRSDPVMTAYKLVTVDAPYWAFGNRLEQAFLSGERALFIQSHRNCFGWIDEWFGMTMQEINELDQQYVESSVKKNDKPIVTSSEKDFDKRYTREGIAMDA